MLRGSNWAFPVTQTLELNEVRDNLPTFGIDPNFAYLDGDVSGNLIFSFALLSYLGGGGAP